MEGVARAKPGKQLVINKNGEFVNLIIQFRLLTTILAPSPFLDYGS